MENNFENNVNVNDAPAADNKAMAFANKVKDGVVAFVDKIKADPKGLGLKLGAIALAAVIFIVGALVVVNATTNTYKTPIKIMQKYDNMRSYYEDSDRQIALANGFCEKELKAMAKLQKSTEDYKDEKADAKEDRKDYIQDMKDEYGNNYKYTYKVIDKEKLDKDELKDIRDSFRDQADEIESMIEETKDYDSDDWKDAADSMGFDGKQSKAKKYVSILKDLRKKYKSAKVTAGYNLTVEITLKGSELDEPEVDEKEFQVIKVNGRWILN